MADIGAVTGEGMSPVGRLVLVLVATGAIEREPGACRAGHHHR